MFLGDECLERYLKSLASGTAENRRPLLEDFFEFCGVSPSDAKAFQEGNPGNYRFVDKAYEWIEKGKLRLNTKRTRMGMIRGFFVANRVPLPKDKHRFHSDVTPVMGELSVQEFHKILLSCNLTYRAAFLVQFQSGSGVGELLYINTEHADYVWSEVKKDRQIIRLTMPGRKQSRNVEPYYTFIGADAIVALRRLFHSRGWKRDTVLFKNEIDQPIAKDNLTTYFRRHAIKLGIIKEHTWPCLDCGGETVKQLKGKRGYRLVYYVCTICQSSHQAQEYELTQHDRAKVRYRARTHEQRDLFKTQCHYAMTYAGFDMDVAKFMMGHGRQIDPNKYDKIMRDVQYTTSQFRRAMPFLNVLSESPMEISRPELDDKFEAQRAEVEALSKELARYRRDSEDLTAFAKVMRDDPELWTLIKKRLQQK